MIHNFTHVKFEFLHENTNGVLSLLLSTCCEHYNLEKNAPTKSAKRLQVVLHGKEMK